jgi:hypothetical protein
VRRELDRLGAPHLEHRERVEPVECAQQPSGLRQRSDDVAAEHDQGAQAPRFDLVGDERGRPFAEQPRSVGT